MSRTNKFFRRNASPMAQHDAGKDREYRRVWAILAASYGIEAANANYCQIRWISGDGATNDEIRQSFEEWRRIEEGRRFKPFDRRLIKILAS